jgi:superoxide dismutase, Cu-Zn family
MAKSVACFVGGEENKATMEGFLMFEQISEDAPTSISGELKGLAPGKHGLSINVYGNLSQGFASLGSHFNPFGKNHGGPSEETRHVGSLGNITANEEGVAKIDISDNLVKLIGPQSVIGRSIAVHASEDDLGKGGHENSLVDGNSGPIVGAGIIGIVG